MKVNFPITFFGELKLTAPSGLCTRIDCIQRRSRGGQSHESPESGEDIYETE